LIAVPQASAQEKDDPAALAKTIAPFLDEQAIAVGRIDLARISVDRLFDKLGSLLPELKVELPLAKMAATAWSQAFLKAGGSDVFAVVSVAGERPFRRPILVVPLRPGADENALRGLFLPPQEFKTDRVGDALVVAESQEDLECVRTIKPDPRPELAAALEAAGFQVWTADSGEEAVGLVEQVHPDAVVSDLRMPGMDGLSLLDRLAQRPGESPATAIIYSAAPPPTPTASPTRDVRWIPKALGHEALIDALRGGHRDPARNPCRSGQSPGYVQAEWAPAPHSRVVFRAEAE